MSLFLPYEKMWDMPLGGTSPDKQVPHWSGNLIWGFLTFVFKICFRFRVDNRKSIRGFDGKSGVVVVANHTSFLDVAFMYLATRPQQWVRFMGRESLFPVAHGLVGQILSRVGAFPIKRDAADRTAIKRATRMLKNNEVVGILPEGTRRGKGSKTPEIHSGAAFIAKMGKAPILPMTVRNAENVKRKGERFHFPKITIEYGNPLLVGDFDFLPKEQRLDGCTWYAMRECFALSLRVPRDQVDMVALFPDGPDFTAVFAEHPIPEHTTEELVAEKGTGHTARTGSLDSGGCAASARDDNKEPQAERKDVSSVTSSGANEADSPSVIPSGANEVSAVEGSRAASAQSASGKDAR